MQKLYTNYLCLILSFLFALPMAVQSQIAAWNLNTNAGNEVSLPSTTPNAQLKTAVLSRGAGVTASTLNNGFTSVGWNNPTQDKAGAISGNKYYQFTISAASGFQVSLSTLDLTIRRSGTGPTNFQWQYSLDGFATPTDGVDVGAAFSDNIASTNGEVQTQLALGGIAALQNVSSAGTITFRLFAWGASTASTGTFAIGRNLTGNSLAIGGTTAVSTTTDPIVGGSPGNLSGFSAVASNPSNPAQVESVSGTNLTDNITIAATGGYEVSIDNSAFSPSVSLTQSGGVVAATPVYVRVVSTATTGPVSGSLSISSPGAATQSYTLTGTVTSNVTVDPPQSLSAIAVSSFEIDLNGAGNIAGDNILVASNSSATFGIPAGVLVAGSTIGGGGKVLYNGPSAGFSFANTGLTPGSKYFYSAWSVDGSNNYSTPVTANATTNNPPAAHVVINQVYGGGGNTDAIYRYDFVELFNNEDTAVDLSGWSVQYAGATGSTWQMTTLKGIIPPHAFFLVREASGADTTLLFPKADDSSGSISMSSASGKVILCNCIVAQSGDNPPGTDLTDTTVRDKFGYGPTATGFETAPTAVLTNTASAQRITDGVDHDNNRTDFKLAIPIPRNRFYTTAAPVVLSFNPPNGVSNIPSGLPLYWVFDKPVQKGSGNITVLEDGSPTVIPVGSTDITITNDTVIVNKPLLSGRSYSVQIDGIAFHDIYGNNFAGISDNSTWAFTTYNTTLTAPLPGIFDFNTCSGSGLLPNGFTQYNVSGTQVWDCTAFGRDPAAPAGTAPAPSAIQINGFANNVNNANSDWLISPRFDLTGTTYPLLTFWSRNNFSGDQLQLKVSTDYTGSGDPALATWTDLNGKFPGEGTNVWTQSLNINLSNFKQPGVFFAFVYKSTTDDGARWTLDDISLINSPTPPDPSLTVSAQDLSFGYTAAGLDSTKTLTVIGNDLTSDISLGTLGTNFLVSTDNINFAGGATIPQAVANNTPVTIYVRFTPGVTNQQFSDHLFITIPNAADTITLKGNSVDPASTLNIVNWNLEWFATPEIGFGPDNKSLQETNVAIILPSLHADLYALQEVVNRNALDSIVNTMPGYAYVINNYGSHSNITEANPFPLTEVQKLAFVYNTAKIKNIRTDSLFSIGVDQAADTHTQAYADWASGRFPYMLTADVVLSDNNGGFITNKMHFINIHAKANTGNIAAAYASRKSAAFSLDTLIARQYKGENVIVLGDFNDDLTHTITSGIKPPTTSYSAFIDSSANYSFPTIPLSLAGQHSDVNFTNSVIDNVIITKTLGNFYFPGSATILTDVSNLVPKYGTTTSDHYPLFTQFSFANTAPLPVKLLDFTGIRQDGQTKLAWATSQETNSSKFDVERSRDGHTFTIIGTVAAQGNSSTRTDYTFYDQQPLDGNNYYRLNQVDKDGRSEYSKVIKLNFGKQLALHINPNPAHAVVNIFVENAAEQVSLQILDMSGRLVRQFELTPTLAPLAVGGLTGGMYTVKVIGKDGVATQKLLVR